MQIFVDESGNLGKKGRYFAIVALTPAKPKRIKNLVKRSCVEYGLPFKIVLPELKAFNLTFPDKQHFLSLLTKEKDFTCSYVVGDLNHIEPKLLVDKNICFNYLASHLLRPLLTGISEDVHIHFDNRTVRVTSIRSLADYIRIEAYANWGFTGSLVIDYVDSKVMKQIQAADIIAYSVLGKYEFGFGTFYKMLEGHFLHRVRFPAAKFGA